MSIPTVITPLSFVTPTVELTEAGDGDGDGEGSPVKLEVRLSGMRSGQVQTRFQVFLTFQIPLNLK